MGWLQNNYWTTQDGHKLYPNEMSDSHLLNTISYIEKKAPAYKLEHELSMYAMPEPRGDGAQMCFESECIRLERMSIIDWLSYYCNIYNLLVKEKQNRNLAKEGKSNEG